ncbi:MurR/RpiR family transcriptional regulator [Ponticoccus sp. SC2-23]|uniref:MurR/RpiR family transcriptional regulator n=1 Tax=Alexandriicola marinus TaxID=2081710 RepID=UPI000FD8B036|nr:MurR/RpiR family transcriptional regulator [Alexandriicola marinus]MBM1221303.1 MurR/RpiR family transcriptional regulator [Ponticoccus sp. SC6-9]MBM1225873.1 MurR/RpiR family transcriptional regulator [Ponticoccus sp. SC6-15]MBM1228025.1 MurR/RpiR family transcriptional regulator [Ponticoccus sp. SC6-38]MBM1234337.1 MurR/RpiR family transcriptional regulator [Ponticoccus sp. SC6-45]MBM1238527.1 MurR/RpiR family transcriptional regulator [Ponticoccus sp. SC6-49]MBM1243796.1 MurR/RpiR famil
MASDPSTSFVSRVQSALETLHPSERRLAEAILNFPGQIASYTATELAQMAGVSNATVTRFVRKIGYGSFEEARQAVRSEQSAGAALFRVDGAGDELKTELAGHLEQSLVNLEQTLSLVEPGTLDALVDRMLNAPRLWVLGFRAGQSFARYLGWQVLQVRSEVTVLPRDGETLAESVAAIQPEDCVILFVLRRPPRIVVDLPEQLRATGASVALIGDLPGLQDLPSRWRVACATGSSGPLFNHVGVMAICNLLASRAVEQMGPEARRRLSRIESLHETLGEL